MKGTFEIKDDRARRTISTRMSGIFTQEEMRAWCTEYRKATDSYRDRPHLVLADMRGMKATHPDVAALLGAEIGYARAHGCVRCAHVSDDTVQRLQAARVARQHSPGDDVTVEVGSTEEAERVLDEARHELLANQAVTPARLVVEQRAPR
ncbi:Hypothetical protein A7982_01995 [Minicystis rosea]|nr:Hypothetical protein A7982_01995 [Minicystis rosea]